MCQGTVAIFAAECCDIAGKLGIQLTILNSTTLYSTTPPPIQLILHGLANEKLFIHLYLIS